MIRLIDTHAHLDGSHLADDLEAVLQRAANDGVTQVVTIGTTVESSRRALALASRFDSVFAAIGIQPNDTGDAADSDWDTIKELAKSHRESIVALGETGIDCYWDRVPLAIQQDYFDRHLDLARELDLPVVIHMRESGQQIVSQLREHWKAESGAGVMHSFTGDEKLMQACLELGLYISFAGMVTFKKSDALRDVATKVPLDRILVETDSPYLSPEPFRGKRPNEPARVVHTAKCLAELHKMDLSEFAAQTTANAIALFGLPKD